MISIADNPNFRAFWLAAKLFANAMDAFGRLIDAASARTEEWMSVQFCNLGVMIVNEPIVAYGEKIYSNRSTWSLETIGRKTWVLPGEIFQMLGHGEFLAMSGAANWHNFMFTSIFTGIASRLNGKSCHPATGRICGFTFPVIHCLPIRISVSIAESRKTARKMKTLLKPHCDHLRSRPHQQGNMTGW